MALSKSSVLAIGSGLGAALSIGVNVPGAYVAYTQASSAREESREAREAALRAEAMLGEARRLADAQEASLLISKGMARSARQAADESGRLADSAGRGAEAAQRSADIGQRQLEVSVAEGRAAGERMLNANRPRLIVTGYEWAMPQAGQRSTTFVKVDNLGSTAPRRLQMWSNLYRTSRTQTVSNGPSCEQIGRDTNQTMTMGKNGNFTSTTRVAITNDDVRYLSDPKLALVLAGKLCYQDDAGRTHATPFCVSYHDGDPHACEVGVDPD